MGITEKPTSARCAQDPRRWWQGLGPILLPFSCVSQGESGEGMPGSRVPGHSVTVVDAGLP